MEFMFGFFLGFVVGSSALYREIDKSIIYYIKNWKNF
jgi:hypothetical protein